ncbi:hypothetical protein CQW23_17706 [Capsicum baccatum]|uniref:Uncharacterized protein n=1 Tax=Capsicum baccatum TaxID=33114 RepID=A0A2G2WEL8_CAPBA|nr:hypothetical protein CQW23_17706 [Capsicum baccatum]
MTDNVPVRNEDVHPELGRLELGFLEKVLPKGDCIITLEEDMIYVFFLVMTYLALGVYGDANVIEVGRLGVKPPSRHGFIPDVTLVKPQPSTVFWASKSIPVDKVKFSQLIRNLNALYNGGRDTTEGGLSEYSSTSHVEKFGLLPSQSLFHVIQDELKVTVPGFIMENGVSKIFAKVLASLDIEGVVVVSLARRVRSSAKKRWESLGPPLVILMGSQFFTLTLESMPLESLSMQRINRYGDMGSPYLIPLEGLKKLVLVPLTKTEIEDEVTQDIMSLVRFPGKPNNSRVSLTKDHSILSKALSKSIFKIILEYFPFILMEWVRLDPIDNDFGDKLVSGVAESNGPKISKIYSLVAFRNEADKGNISILRHGESKECLPTEVQGFSSHNVSELLEEEGMKPSGPGVFRGLNDLRASRTQESLRGEPRRYLASSERILGWEVLVGTK